MCADHHHHHHHHHQTQHEKAAFPCDFKSWLAKLISFDTTSRNSNLELIYYVRDYFKTYDINSLIVYSPEKTHANLFATIPASDGSTQGGIILSGHTDVVPVDGQKWDSDPFTMIEKDGKLFGRGACDMKGFLAVALALTPTFHSLKRSKPIHFAFSYDEEVGCTGVPVLTNHLIDKGFRADCCLIGEPTDMKVYIASKGMGIWKVIVHGKAIHSSLALMNTSCNAIEYASQIISKIREIAIDLRENGVQAVKYDCPFPCISTGLINGGNAVNTVPAECEFVFSVRLSEMGTCSEIEKRVQTFIDESILPSMRKEFPEASVEFINQLRMLPFNGDEQAEFTKEVLRLTNETKMHYFGGGTEGGYFQSDMKVPTVVVGPGPGKMAHLANEYVLVSQMEKSTQFTLQLVKLYTDPSCAVSGKL